MKMIWKLKQNLQVYEGQPKLDNMTPFQPLYEWEKLKFFRTMDFTSVTQKEYIESEQHLAYRFS